MKKIAAMIGAGLLLAMPVGVMAQSPPATHHLNQGSIGVFADYLRLTPGPKAINYVGLGGRVGFHVSPHWALEAEMDYEFARNYTQTYTGTGTSTTTTTFVTSGVRPLSGLFGPKLQIGTGAVRAFLTGKVRFINFTNNGTKAVNGTTFTNGVSSFGGAGTHFAMYPGGGIEAYIGPVGIRAEVGDEAYADNGVNNNMRVTVGPEFRF